MNACSSSRRKQRMLGGVCLAEDTWITEQACEGISSLVTLETGSLDLLSDLLIWSVSPEYSEIYILCFYFYFFLLRRLISISLVFFMLLKVCFQDGCILLSPRSSSPHGNGGVLPLHSNQLRVPLQGLDQFRYFQESMLAMKYSYSFPKLTCNSFI